MAIYIRIRQPGIFTSVQDRGRFLYQDIGVPPSGALDTISLLVANALVGNEPDAAALEALSVGPELEAVGGPIRIALTGGATEARIIGERPRRAPPFESFPLMPGELLRIGVITGSSCVYAAFAGGLCVPLTLGSRSTYSRGQIGGLDGRAIKLNDELLVGASDTLNGPEHRLEGPPEFGSGSVRIVMGPQDDYFTEEAKEMLVQSRFIVSKNSDRVGMRLLGPALAHVSEQEMPSDGTVTGNIQVPGNGEPIILLPDRSTTGGYPKIATIISAELPRVCRMLPGQEIRFVAVSQTDAIAYTRARHQYMKGLLSQIRPIVRRDINSSHLMALNLIDGVVSGDDE